MTESGILFSVVIPAYNYGDLIGRALDSVLGQWADDIELLVVNDGSTDNTAAVLGDFAGRNPGRIQVVHQGNAGPSAARNRGIGLSKGQYVLLLDADDELMPRAFECLRVALKENPEASLVLGGQVSVYPSGKERLRLPDSIVGPPVLRIRRYLLEKRIAIAHGSSLFRRDLLLQRPYPESLRGGEDIAVFAYALAFGRVVTIGEPLARVHKHANSLRRAPRDDDEYIARMTHEVFDCLPAECQALRKRFQGQRYLSLFRTAFLMGDADRAFQYYQEAMRVNLRQALKWDYVRKLFKLWFR